LLGDVDDFKRYNDCYEHEVGDTILVALAEMMCADLRGQDLVARWGGEEFLVLLPGTHLDKACRVAERLWERIASTPIAIGAEHVLVTMTPGLAEHAGETDPVVACIKRADEVSQANFRFRT
jgi:diguanylate cyclase (GGDEF)-like protein